MHILYDHTMFVLQRVGGISRYFSELIPHVLRAQDADVSLFMGLHRNEYGLERRRREFRHFWGLRRPGVRRTHRAALALSNGLLRFFPGRDAEVYHATGYTHLLPRFGGKRVVTVHDLIDERFHFNGADPARRAVFHNADGVICVSESTQRDLKEFYGIDDRKIRVIHHANSLTAAPAEEKPCKSPYFLYVGRREGYKNFQMLLHALSQMRLANASHVVCFGGGPLTGEELRMAEKLGLAGRIEMFSGSDALLASLYAHAIAFVYPSKYEGFGIPMLEAMHYGCPVVAARDSSLPEVAGEAALYFDPASTNELAGRLDEIVSNEALRGGLAELGREREKMFSWIKAAQETLKFYHELVGATPHG